MSSALKLVTPATEEPVSLEAVKLHLRVDGDTEDAYITSLIKAARDFVERKTDRALMTQTWDLFIDHFPARANPRAEFWDGQRDGSIIDLFSQSPELKIPKTPLVSVESLKYFNAANEELTLSADSYYVDTASTPARIVLKQGQMWPVTLLRRANGVQVRFQAGYADADEIPGTIIQAIMMLVAYWFENRETVLVGSISKELEFSTAALLQTFRTARL